MRLRFIFVLLIVSVLGCASSQSSRVAELNGINSIYTNKISLDRRILSENKNIHLVAVNKTSRQLDFQMRLADAFKRRGYQVVDDPSIAGHSLYAELKFLDEVRVERIGGSPDESSIMFQSLSGNVFAGIFSLFLMAADLLQGKETVKFIGRLEIRITDSEGKIHETTFLADAPAYNKDFIADEVLERLIQQVVELF